VTARCARGDGPLRSRWFGASRFVRKYETGPSLPNGSAQALTGSIAKPIRNNPVDRLAKHTIPLIAVIAVLVASACVGSRLPLDEMPKDVTWLALSLENEGVVVRERGSAFLNTTATENVRLVLDGREVVDAFVFGSESAAGDEARRMAGLYPRNQVFLTDRLVVLRYTTRDTGLTGTLMQVLGRPV